MFDYSKILHNRYGLDSNTLVQKFNRSKCCLCNVYTDNRLKYVLKILKKNKNSLETNYQTLLSIKDNSSDIPFLLPKLNKFGNAITLLNGNQALLFPFLDSSSPALSNQNHVQKIAEALKLLHQSTLTEYRFTKSAKTDISVLPMTNKEKRIINSILESYVPSGDIGLLHGDLDFTNILVDKQNRIFIIDFDEMRYGYVHEEVIRSLIGFFLIHEQNRIEFNGKNAKFFLSSYDVNYKNWLSMDTYFNYALIDLISEYRIYWSDSKFESAERALYKLKYFVANRFKMFSEIV